MSCYIQQCLPIFKCGKGRSAIELRDCLGLSMTPEFQHNDLSLCHPKKKTWTCFWPCIISSYNIGLNVFALQLRRNVELDLFHWVMIVLLKRPCFFAFRYCLALHDVRAICPSSTTINKRSNSGHVGAWNVWQISRGQMTILICCVSSGRRLGPHLGSP